METKSNEELYKRRLESIPLGVSAHQKSFIAKGEGAVITDVEGKRYIDFAGGIGVLNVGHCPKEVMAAINEQLGKYLHTSFSLIMYEPYVQAAEKLNAITPGNFPKKSLFLNSGAEAIENAIKIARFYTKRQGIICFERAFHGRTLLSMSLTSKVKPFKFGFGPFAPEIHRVPYAYCYRCLFGKEYPSCELYCAEFLEEFFLSHIAAEEVAAILIEPVLGEGGYVVPPRDYLRKLSDICNANGILFIADEIQSGMGRTGKMFAIEYYDVEPDLICTGKSLAAGLPLSAVTGKKEIMDSLPSGSLGGTLGGNPLACSAALAVLKIFEKQNLLEKSKRIGSILKYHLERMKEDYEIIGDVRGIGAMMGIELVENRQTKKPATEKTASIIKRCFEKGLILLPCGLHRNVIRFLMPLIISEDQLVEGLTILDDSFKEMLAQLK